MLDEYECHAIAGSQRTHELPAGIEATGRRTDADDWKILESSTGGPRAESVRELVDDRLVLACLGRLIGMAELSLGGGLPPDKTLNLTVPRLVHRSVFIGAQYPQISALGLAAARVTCETFE